MKNELMEEMYSQENLRKKAAICDELFVLMNNSLGFFYEQGWDAKETAEYLGISADRLNAVENEDADLLAGAKNRPLLNNREAQEAAQEQFEMENKAAAYDELLVLLHNAFGFFYEQEMDEEQTADYIGTTTDIIDAVEDSDLKALTANLLD